MPRETVSHGEIQTMSDMDGGNARVCGTPSLSVRWDRDHEYVQVQLDADPEFWKQIVKDNCPTATSNVLSRKELNHLIRTLRRARDAAYGSDE